MNYKEIVTKHDSRGASAVGNIERFAFYEEAKKLLPRPLLLRERKIVPINIL